MNKHVCELVKFAREHVEMWNTFAALEGDRRRLSFARIDGKHFSEIRFGINDPRKFFPNNTLTIPTGFKILINKNDKSLTKVVLSEFELKNKEIWPSYLKGKNIIIKHGVVGKKIIYVQVSNISEIDTLLEIQKGALESNEF